MITTKYVTSHPASAAYTKQREWNSDNAYSNKASTSSCRKYRIYELIGSMEDIFLKINQGRNITPNSYYILHCVKQKIVPCIFCK
jgi:hypothetical protein